MIQGTVYKSTGSWYLVKSQDKFFECRIKGKIRLKDISTTNPIAVGDNVIFELENDGNGSNSGHVRIYDYNSATASWTQVGDDIDGEASNDSSGYSVSLSSDGSIVAIGAQGNDENGSMSGHVRIYRYDSSSDSWSQLGDDIDGEAANYRTGWSTSLDAMQHGRQAISSKPKSLMPRQ